VLDCIAKSGTSLKHAQSPAKPGEDLLSVRAEHLSIEALYVDEDYLDGCTHCPCACLRPSEAVAMQHQIFLLFPVFSRSHLFQAIVLIEKKLHLQFGGPASELCNNVRSATGLLSILISNLVW
jgi:hypothetical protein